MNFWEIAEVMQETVYILSLTKIELTMEQNDKQQVERVFIKKNPIIVWENLNIGRSGASIYDHKKTPQLTETRACRRKMESN